MRPRDWFHAVVNAAIGVLQGIAAHGFGKLLISVAAMACTGMFGVPANSSHPSLSLQYNTVPEK